MAALTTRAGPGSQTLRLPQVFICFRGEDVRESFVSDLVNKLKQKGVNVFIDTFLREGRSILQLITKIEESKIAVVIFSKRFPESDWCMNELVKISNLRKERRLIVIPIFYKVTTSDVKNLTGDFGKSFKKLKKKYAGKLSPGGYCVQIRKWEDSVKSIANIKGLTSSSSTLYPFAQTTNKLRKEVLLSQINHAVQVWLNEMPAREFETSLMVRVFVDFWSYAFAVALFVSIFLYLVDNNTKPFKSGKWMIGFPTLVAIFFCFAICVS